MIEEGMTTDMSASGVNKPPTCQCPKWPDEGPCRRQPTGEDSLCDGCRPAKPGTVNNCSRIRFGDQRATGHWIEPAMQDLRLPIEAAHGWEPT